MWPSYKFRKGMWKLQSFSQSFLPFSLLIIKYTFFSPSQIIFSLKVHCPICPSVTAFGASPRYFFCVTTFDIKLKIYITVFNIQWQNKERITTLNISKHKGKKENDSKFPACQHFEGSHFVLCEELLCTLFSIALVSVILVVSPKLHQIWMLGAWLLLRLYRIQSLPSLHGSLRDKHCCKYQKVKGFKKLIFKAYFFAQYFFNSVINISSFFKMIYTFN